jgi:hypothetical protein
MLGLLKFQEKASYHAFVLANLIEAVWSEKFYGFLEFSNKSYFFSFVKWQNIFFQV